MLNDRSNGDRAHGSRGFTLIEMMVTVSLIAVSAALVAPNFSQLIANSRVRAGAESILNGLNYARAEAVRRNSPVQFALAGGGSSWTVSQVAPSVVIQARPGGDSSGTTAASSNASSAVTFLPTGLVDSSGTWLTQVTVSSAMSGTDSRRINVLGGGLIRMCDPAATSASDPRRC